MRTRLTAAMLALVAGTLMVSAFGGVVLARRSALGTSEQQLSAEAHIVANLADDQIRPGILTHLALLRQAGDYRSLAVVDADSAGQAIGVRSARFTVTPRRAAELAAGRTVTGNAGAVVYVLVPLDLSALQKDALQPPVAFEQQAVLVATRTVRLHVSGLALFVALALGALAAAAAVASWLASRLSRPLRDAVAVAGRIDDGDLTARMPDPGGRAPELAALATSLNTMADSLQRARHQQRQFLLSVSHDLRTPLTSITGYADAIIDGAATDIPAAVSVIRSEATRLERLVGDLLDLARLDARRFSLDPRPVDLAALVAGVVDGFGPEAAAAGLALTTSLPDDDPPVAVADPDRLAQIVSNLIDNASRYAATRVVAGTRTDGPTVVLWVSDDGPGIAAADLARVFEPHFSSGRGGTGLGLAIVAELAQAMGGTVRADSPLEDGRGTRLTLRLASTPR